MGLPLQKLPAYQKGKQWKKDTVDYFERLSQSSGTSNRSSNYTKKINYDLLNGKFNKADLAYVCDPLGVGADEYPATLQNMDIISPAFNLLASEEGTRPDNCTVISESPEDISRKQQALKEKIMYSLQQHIAQQIDPSTVDPNNPPPTPEEIIKYDKYNISDLKESKANRLHKHLRRYLNTRQVFKKGWTDVLCAGEEIYWAGINGNEVLFRRCNPLNVSVVLDGDSDFIDDAIAVVETRLLSPSTILDEFGEELTPADVKTLEDYTRRTSNFMGNIHSDAMFTYTKNGVEDTGLTSNNGTTAGSYMSELIRVVRVEWKSLKKLYHLTYTDETGIAQELIVDESFQIKAFRDSYPDALVEEFWINEAWEGVKIGDDIYVSVQAKPNQRRRLDNPYYCKLGYTGYIYNSTNSRSVSLMDRVKPYQYLYNVISYRLELAFASDLGKIFLMDLAQIPRSEGMDIERWMYYLRAMKIAFINSFEEGKKGSATGQFASNRFNQFTQIDLTLANTIQQYIQTLDYIKQQVAFISGVSPQRLGAIDTRELVGNVERSVQQSALITEYLFDSHDEVKRRCYIALIECAKIAYKGGKKIQYILDDMGMELLDLEEGEFEDTEFNVFMSSATKDNQLKNDAKQLFTLAIQNDKADLSTIVDSLINDSPRDMLRTIQRAEQEKYARDKAAQDAEQATAQKQIEAQQQTAEMESEQRQLDRDLKQYEVDQNNSTKITIAEIGAYIGQQSLDQDNDGIPDPIEIANLELSRQEIASKSYIEREKASREKDKHEKEVAIKEKELRLKQDLENKKIDAIKVQNQSQEKMQQNQLANDDKTRKAESEAEAKRLAHEKKMHEDDVKLKKQELEIKKSDLKNKIELEKIKLQAAKEKAKMDMQKQRIQIQKAKQSAKPKPKPNK
jgi:hypothetical protein